VIDDDDDDDDDLPAVQLPFIEHRVSRSGSLDGWDDNGWRTSPQNDRDIAVAATDEETSRWTELLRDTWLDLVLRREVDCRDADCTSLNVDDLHRALGEFTCRNHTTAVIMTMLKDAAVPKQIL